MQFIDDYTTWKIISKQGKQLLDLPYCISPNHCPQGELLALPHRSVCEI